MCLMLIQERSENCHVYMVTDLRYILGEHPALNHHHHHHTEQACNLT